MADYLIIGGHGKVALRTAPLLTQAGHTVTSVIRNPDQSRDVEATGAIPLVLDIETASLADLLRVSRGRDAVIWSAGAEAGVPSAPVPWTATPRSARSMPPPPPVSTAT